MKNIAAIILAAGEGTRMKSSMPKVLHSICGRSMIQHLVDSINSIGIKKIVVIVGHKADLVTKTLKGLQCIKQDKLLGTADAVLKAKGIL